VFCHSDRGRPSFFCDAASGARDLLSVEAACVAELGRDSGVEALAGCAAKLAAHCAAEVQAGGALFFDGDFIGADTCLGQIDVDVEIDAEACVRA